MCSLLRSMSTSIEKFTISVQLSKVYNTRYLNFVNVKSLQQTYHFSALFKNWAVIQFSGSPVGVDKRRRNYVVPNGRRRCFLHLKLLLGLSYCFLAAGDTDALTGHFHKRVSGHTCPIFRISRNARHEGACRLDYKRLKDGGHQKTWNLSSHDVQGSGDSCQAPNYHLTCLTLMSHFSQFPRTLDRLG